MMNETLIKRLLKSNLPYEVISCDTLQYYLNGHNVSIWMSTDATFSNDINKNIDLYIDDVRYDIDVYTFTDSEFFELFSIYLKKLTIGREAVVTAILNSITNIDDFDTAQNELVQQDEN